MGAGRSELLRNERFAGDPTLAAVARGDRVLRHGDRGPAVAAVQQALVDGGFGLRRWPGVHGREVGGVDGILGTQTSRAVRRFQLSRGLPPDGDVDAPTLNELDAVSPSPGHTAWAEGPRFPSPTPVLTVGKETQVLRVAVALEEGRTWLFDPDGRLQGIFAHAAANGPTPVHVGLKVVTGLYDQSVAESEGLRLWDDPGVFGSRIVDLAWWDPESRRSWPGGEMLHGTSDRRSVGGTPHVGSVRHYDEDIEAIWASLAVGDLVAVTARVSDAPWPPAHHAGAVTRTWDDFRA